ncbi:MAG: ParA family protein [Planctomycetes bacterium]|nr:ParA family protein [Planctomycetota bacterium]
MLVAFLSEKGGAGKTTLAALIGERLAQLGAPLELADGDPQASLAAVAEASGGRIPQAMEVGPGTFPTLAQRPGLTLLDLPSGINERFDAALAVCDAVIIPVVPSAFDLRTLPATLSRVRQAQDLRGGPPRALLVPNKLCLREPMTKELLATLSHLQWPVSQRWLLQRSAYTRMGEAGLGALPRNSRRQADDEVVALVDEVIERLELTIHPAAGREPAQPQQEGQAA